MSNIEFRNNFDILYNNIMSNAAPGINDYEKSVLLTKAQDEILKNYFNPKGNKYQEGFDDSSKRQIDFSGLISIAECELKDNQSGYDLRSKVFGMPEDLFLIINESLITDLGVKQVVPISFEEYTRLMSRPYKEPLKNQAWRLITGSTDNNINVEIIPHTNEVISKYNVRYVRKPKPIILVDLASEYGEDVTINGISEESECELNPLLHEEILQRAVELAKIIYTGDANGLLQTGQRSE